MALYGFCGLTVKMNPIYKKLTERALPYFIGDDDSEHDIFVPFTKSASERVSAACPTLSPEEAEYLLCGDKFHRKLLSFDGMMLHSSAVVYNGRAYLFSAPPGTGKSTHTALWTSALGDSAFILNDDKPALRKVSGCVIAFGTPFSGTSPLNRNTSAPLGGICILERGERDEIRRISPAEALPYLCKETMKLLKKEDGERMLEMLSSIVSEVPLMRLRCTPTVGAARCSFEALTGESAPF